MRSLPLLLWAALLLPANAPLPPDAQGLLTFGPTGDRYRVRGEDDDDALQRVLDTEFTASGGELIILPGTYTFDEPVTIHGRGRRILGFGATIVADGAPTLFEVDGGDCHLEGLNLESRPQPFEQVLVRVNSRNFRMRDCSLVRKSSVSPEPERAVTLVELAPGHDDVEITGNLFRFGECYAADGGGLLTRRPCAERNIGLIARLGSGVRLNGNAFRPDEWSYTDPSGTYPAGGDLYDAVQFRGETNVTASSNTFIGLNSADPAHALIWAGEESFVSTRGLLVFANFCENPTVQHSIVLEGVLDSSISGNVFGRSQGGIRLAAGESTAQGRGAEIWGNQFHNLGNFTDTETAVQISGQNTVAVQHNQFTLCGRHQIEIASDVRGAMVSGNLFMLDNSDTDPCAAIEIDLEGGAPGGHHLSGNSAPGSPFGRARWCQLARLSRRCPDKVSSVDNWTDRLVGCSPVDGCTPSIATCD